MLFKSLDFHASKYRLLNTALYIFFNKFRNALTYGKLLLFIPYLFPLTFWLTGYELDYIWEQELK